MEKRHCLRKWIWCLLLVGVTAFCAVEAGWEFPGLRVQAASERTLSRRYSKDMDQETGQWIDMAGEALNQIAEEREVMALVYLSDEYPVRQTPSYGSRPAVTVLSGQQVNILDVYVDDDFEVWEYVTLTHGGKEYYGYIPRGYLAVSDSRFLEWEEAYGMNPGAAVYSVSGGDRDNTDIEQFPESYRAALYALREKHPNWIFVKMNTTLDWNDVIYNEMQNSRSLVYKTFPDWARGELYDRGNWYYATEPVLKMYMDPRNWLEEDTVFQFEFLTYKEECHTEEAIRAFLNNTFMRSGDDDSIKAPGTIFTYAQIFWLIGKEEGRKVSPFHLAARVLQEQGNGSSPLISGTYPGYEGYYNYFNIRASGKTNEEIYENGLSYAASKDWDNAYQSIRGGADIISENYIQKGQDTLYLQKYNVNPDEYYKPYTHQYMQNISAPATEAQKIQKLYADADALNSVFSFKIPVYENMPETPCGEPEESLTITMQVPEGYSEPVVYLDGIACRATIQDGWYMLEAPDKDRRTAVAYRYNAAGVPDGMYVWSLDYKSKRYIVTPEPGLADLLTAHGFSARITGETGIRFKTGIAQDTRAALTGGGINGYTLKEYGTVIMNYANVGAYPMIKGGQKTTFGMAYGIEETGAKKDIIFETVGGRYRYTAVLTGLPVSRYKTEYAFRGYATLEKDGEQVTLYGPIRARSLYALAKQLLETNAYAPGTAAYDYLQKIVSDADADEAAVSGGNAG